MKRAQKSTKVERLVPLLWCDCSWTKQINIRPQPPCSREMFAGHSNRRASIPFSPFRGFHFSQLAVQRK
jgi:hypothetical protein